MFLNVVQTHAQTYAPRLLVSLTMLLHDAGIMLRASSGESSHMRSWQSTHMCQIMLCQCAETWCTANDDDRMQTASQIPQECPFVSILLSSSLTVLHTREVLEKQPQQLRRPAWMLGTTGSSPLHHMQHLSPTCHLLQHGATWCSWSGSSSGLYSDCTPFLVGTRHSGDEAMQQVDVHLVANQHTTRTTRHIWMSLLATFQPRQACIGAEAPHLSYCLTQCWLHVVWHGTGSHQAASAPAIEGLPDYPTAPGLRSWPGSGLWGSTQALS